jgi:acetate kinase
MFCRSMLMSMGALATEFGGLDLPVVTGGIDEHAPAVRREICEGSSTWAWPSPKASPACSDSATARARVVPTDENLMTARQARNLVLREGGNP